MKAIIMAAGVGERLGLDYPKSLLRFAGKTLIERHIASLQRVGVGEAVLVIGYQADVVRAALAALPAGGLSLSIRLVVNLEYQRGSVLSLKAAAAELRQGEDILLMDADVLYALPILQRLADTPIANCFLIDRNFEPGDEPVKLCVREGQPVEFSKQPRADIACDFAGESVGFFRFAAETAAALAECTERYAAAGCEDAPFEDAIRDLLFAQPQAFGFEDITGLPWIEIDFPDDVERAEREILPRIMTYE
ncbi:MAG: NTP transferase domain-containing protein [Burkholderiales bacterium]